MSSLAAQFSVPHLVLLYVIKIINGVFSSKIFLTKDLQDYGAWLCVCVFFSHNIFILLCISFILEHNQKYFILPCKCVT